MLDLPTLTTPEWPERAGLYRCTADVYHAVKALSASRLKLCRTSMAAFRENKPKADTEGMRYGRGLDCYITEPDQFASRFIVAPEVNFAKKGAKDEWCAWANNLIGDAIVAPSMGADELRERFAAAVRAQGRDVVEADWLPTIKAMREGVRANPNAEHFVASKGESQLAGFWRHPEYGWPCKMLADKVLPRAEGGVWIVDVKVVSELGDPELLDDDGKVRRFRWRGLEKYSRVYGLPTQAAWYEHGYRECAKAMGLDERAYLTFIGIERPAPHRCVWFSPSSEALARAENQIAGWLADIAGCVKSGVWPGVPTGIQVVD